MPTGLLGRKIGMTQVFDEGGRVVPVTVIQAGPCWVTRVKTVEKDGVRSVQLGFGNKKRLNEPERGHLRASGAQSRHLRDMRNDGDDEYTVGQTIAADFFTAATSTRMLRVGYFGYGWSYSFATARR